MPSKPVFVGPIDDVFRCTAIQWSMPYSGSATKQSLSDRRVGFSGTRFAWLFVHRGGYLALPARILLATPSVRGAVGEPTAPRPDGFGGHPCPPVGRGPKKTPHYPYGGGLFWPASSNKELASMLALPHPCGSCGGIHATASFKGYPPFWFLVFVLTIDQVSRVDRGGQKR
jgi:hypothetical protein